MAIKHVSKLMSAVKAVSLARVSVKAGMRNGMEYGTEYRMKNLVIKESCS